MRLPHSPSGVALVVLSSDRYAALWPVFFHFFFKNWRDCNYPVYLAANDQRYVHRRVTCALSGRDADWSSSIRASLAQIDAPHLLCMMDDMFLTRPVPGETIGRLVGRAVQARIEHLQLQPYQYVGAIPTPDDRMVRLHERARFRVSLYGLTFWRREVFTRLLSPGESAWFFEIGATRRSRSYSEFFATTEQVVPGMVHALEKGAWLPDAVSAVERLGIDVRAFPFAVQRLSGLRRAWRWLKHRAGMLLPLSLQIPLQWAVFRVYRAFGYVR
jgi:hypothetical protein